MNSIRTAAILALLAVIITGVSVANKPNEGTDTSITVSPSTLVLSRYVADVTVHSNIIYNSLSEEDKASLRLSGPVGDLIEPLYTFSDARGHLVVKFEAEEVKTIVELGKIELDLVLVTDDVVPAQLIASDEIRVKK